MWPFLAILNDHHFLILLQKIKMLLFLMKFEQIQKLQWILNLFIENRSQTRHDIFVFSNVDHPLHQGGIKTRNFPYLHLSVFSFLFFFYLFSLSYIFPLRYQSIGEEPWFLFLYANSMCRYLFFTF